MGAKAGAGALALIVAAVTAAAVTHKNVPPNEKLNDDNAYNLGRDIGVLFATEAAYRAANGTYTADPTALRAAGYTEVPETHVQIFVGINGGTAVCIIGHLGSAPPYALYDSALGINDTQFHSQADATEQCSDHTITSYVPID